MKTLPPLNSSRSSMACGLFLLFSIAQGVAQTSVVINEVMADNESALTNDGLFPDWVELYNTTAAPVDLSDWSLTDNLSQTRKFVFAAGTILAPNAFLLVYCDDQTNSPGIHTDFSLSDKGEALGLYDNLANGGVQRDVVVFGLQLKDRSIGRFPDFTGAFTLNNPTPLAANAIATLGSPATLKINEWSAINGPSVDDPDADWLEIYNPDPAPVLLTGLVITDSATVPPPNPALTNLSFIDGHGFVQFFADDKVTPADNVNFKLGSSNGDRIRLYDTDRTTLIDSIDFGPQTLNISQGRFPDGSTEIIFFPVDQSTPGESNLRVSIDSFQRDGLALRLCFGAYAGLTYSVLTSDSLTGSNWTKVTDVTAAATGSECVSIPFSTALGARFYRLVTPARQ